MLVTILIAINLLLLSILDCKYQKVPILLILSLFVLTLLHIIDLLPFIYITTFSVLLCIQRKLQFGDLLVLASLSLTIPLHKLTQFLYILTISALSIGVFWRHIRCDTKSPMMPSILISWLLSL
jgi:hypothetical protein